MANKLSISSTKPLQIFKSTNDKISYTSKCFTAQLCAQKRSPSDKCCVHTQTQMWKILGTSREANATLLSSQTIFNFQSCLFPKSVYVIIKTTHHNYYWFLSLSFYMNVFPVLKRPVNNKIDCKSQLHLLMMEGIVTQNCMPLQFNLKLCCLIADWPCSVQKCIYFAYLSSLLFIRLRHIVIHATFSGSNWT